MKRILINFSCLIVFGSAWLMLVPRTNFEPRYEVVGQVDQDTLKIDERPMWVVPENIPTPVVVTIYHPVSNQTDSTPNILADGTKININKAGEYRFCALSRDLLSRWDGPFSYGDTVLIDGIGRFSGKWIVKDTMNKRWTNRVDLLVDIGTRPYKFEVASIRKVI